MREPLDKVIREHADAITVKRVFGEPYEHNGVTVIPAATVFGGGGGGEGEPPEGNGSRSGRGTGFGLRARPAGAYVIRGNDVSWQPAIDVNRIIGGAFAIAALALVVSGRRNR